ncbi:hypothetical protein J7E70_02310 [Variovorax paradoxus]|nr:hypothetical protein [Variovorax paradoxus]MBT2299287.1 hypothetical protein [Variovorax paradoxus]
MVNHMKTYARMVGGFVAEIIEPLFDPNGVEVPIEERFHPDIVAQLVPYDPANPPPAPPAPPMKTHAELVEIARAETRVKRLPIMSVLDGLQVSAVTVGEMEKALAIEGAKDGLRGLTEVDLSGCTTFEAMRLAVKARYLEIASAVPADVKAAFAEALK